MLKEMENRTSNAENLHSKEQSMRDYHINPAILMLTEL